MNKLNQQKGFLSIISVILILIMSIIAVAATYQFTADSRSSGYQLANAQAFYMAMAGLQRADHAITVNKNTCSSINGSSDYTNATFNGAPGVFTVTGTSTQTYNTLKNTVNINDNSITLNSTSGFASSGTITIENEILNYTNISGNTLQNITHGAGGTTAVSHSSGTPVNQNQCVLTATGGVPNLNAVTSSTPPQGKRILQQILAGNYFSIGYSNNKFISPTISSIGNASFSGNGVITNANVTASNPAFAGSTVVSAGKVSFSGNGGTKISNGAEGTITSSSASKINADVIQSYTSINTNNLFTAYFSQSKSAIRAIADKSYNSSNITNGGANGKLIWMDSNLTLSKNTVGSSTNPVILIVNGNVSLSGSATIYGFVYTTGNLTLSGNGGIMGEAATEKALNVSGNGANFDINVLGRTAGLGGSNLATQYYQTPVSTQEINP